MSIGAVEARIAQIQGQLQQLAPTSMNGAQFAQMMTGATAAYSPTGAPATSSTTTADAVIAEAKKYVGMPYVWGGSSPADGGMDCSGLLQYVYGKYGVDLPRVSADQARAGVEVGSLAEARPGDLVAWDNSSRNVGADHIAMYLGDGMILDAPRTGLDIRIISIEDAGLGTPDYIRRVLPDSPVTSSAPVAAPSSTSSVAGVPYADLFNAAGRQYGVDPVLLAAMARTESNFDPAAVSPAGAQGLMQLMPGTAKGLGVTDPFDPTQSVDGAARLMRDLLDRFGRVDHALAGYNAGPGAVLRYDGIPPYAETQGYVSKILALVQGAS